MPTWLFKQTVGLIQQKQAMEKALSDITMMNAGKKREEALTMPNRFFPRPEAHLGQVKKYQATLDDLTQENEGLKKKGQGRKQRQAVVGGGKAQTGKRTATAVYTENPAGSAAGYPAAASTAERTGRPGLICTLKIEYSGDTHDKR